MKVISIKEPFASLIKERIKHIETRSWKTNYRGKIYIHVSKSKVNYKEKRICSLINLLSDSNFMYGNIICSANLVDCIYMDKEFIESVDRTELYCGYYEEGIYAWLLDDIEVIDPVEAKGQLGIWNYYN